MLLKKNVLFCLCVISCSGLFSTILSLAATANSGFIPVENMQHFLSLAVELVGSSLVLSCICIWEVTLSVACSLLRVVLLSEIFGLLQ